MRVNLLILILLVGHGAQAAGLQSEFAIGRAFYTDGEFKKAAAHFELALRINPNNAEACHWTGMAYQAMADIAAPLEHKYHSRARIYLTKAVELAPNRPDYRRELFDFLLGSTGSSRARLRQAADILRTVPESDPDYNYMWQRFEQEKSVNGSVGGRLGRLFLSVPRAAYGIGEVSASALSSRRQTASLAD